jgi:radical SAM protein with 4Fe4S-binding SPASM domain
MTNGCLVTAKVAAFLKEVGTESAQVSLDSADRLQHESHRGPGSFSGTVEGIRHLVANGIRTTVAAVYWANAPADLEALAALCCDLGVHGLRISSVNSQGRARSLAVPDYDCTMTPQWAVGIKHLKDLTEGRLSIASIFDAVRGEGTNTCAGCLTIREEVFIRADGTVLPCGLLAGEPASPVLGRLPFDSLETIESRRSLLTIPDVEDNEDCVSCKWVGICQGGCPAQAYIRTGSFRDLQSQCSAMKSLLEGIKELVPAAEYRTGN